MAQHEANTKSAEKLKRWGEKLAEKEAELQKREAYIAKREQEIAEAQKQAGLYAEQKGISQDVPEVQVHAYKCISNRIEQLYESFLGLRDKMELVKGVESTPEERNQVSLEYARLKGNLLREMAVFREIMTPEEIGTIKVGDKEATLGSVLVQLLRILKIVTPQKNAGETCFVRNTNGNLSQMSEVQIKNLEKQMNKEKGWIIGLVEAYSGVS